LCAAREHTSPVAPRPVIRVTPPAGPVPSRLGAGSAGGGRVPRLRGRTRSRLAPVEVFPGAPAPDDADVAAVDEELGRERPRVVLARHDEAVGPGVEEDD